MNTETQPNNEQQTGEQQTGQTGENANGNNNPSNPVVTEKKEQNQQTPVTEKPKRHDYREKCTCGNCRTIRRQLEKQNQQQGQTQPQQQKPAKVKQQPTLQDGEDVVRIEDSTWNAMRSKITQLKAKFPGDMSDQEFMNKFLNVAAVYYCENL